MSNQESMFSPPEQVGSTQQQQQQYYNPDPREQRPGENQGRYQEPVARAGEYEDGYTGHNQDYAFYTQHEKLKSERPRPQNQQVLYLIIIALLIIIAAGGVGSLISALASALSSVVGIGIVAFILIAIFYTKPVALSPKSFTVQEQARLVINSEAGNIRLWRGESRRVEVRATRHVSQIFGSQQQDVDPIRYTQNGDMLNIDVKQSRGVFWQMGMVTLDIYVPDGSHVQLAMNAGTLYLSGVQGYVDGKTNAGTIHIEKSNLQKGSSFKTNAGTIHIEQSTLHGDARYETNAGTIHVQQTTLNGSVNMSTNAGTIHYEGSLARTGNYQFKTNAGTIHFVLPTDSAFELSSRTSMGTVHNAFGSNTVGVEPRARLDLQTDVGTIHVERR